VGGNGRGGGGGDSGGGGGGLRACWHALVRCVGGDNGVVVVVPVHEVNLSLSPGSEQAVFGKTFPRARRHAPNLESSFPAFYINATWLRTVHPLQTMLRVRVRLPMVLYKP
jgi:hypothetical protein